MATQKMSCWARLVSHLQELFVGIIIICLVTLFQIQLDFSSDEACACTQCLTEGEEDPWFTERYNRLVPKLLSRQNSQLSPETNKWWQRIQGRPSKENYSAVVESLFSLFPDEEHYSDAGPHRCRTCAVVGNSGNLEGSHYGPLIDAHDFVIRMNQAPTAGFEKDVGSKTTHRAFFPESAVDLDNSTHLLLLPFKLKDLQWLIGVFTDKNIKLLNRKAKLTLQANKDKVLILNPEFMKYVHESWLKKIGRYPSTGFIMLVLSLHICDQVSLFGFGAGKNGNWHHYFEKKYHNLNRGNHKGGTEYSVILKLQQKNKIQMYKGW